MAWWSSEPEETYGERNARAHQERDRAAHDLRTEEWERKIAYESERDWISRNQNHKQSVFRVELEQARREGRKPLYYSPEEVPDLPRPEAPAEPQPSIWDMGWKGIVFRLGVHAFMKSRERREAAAQAQAQYAQQGYPQGAYPGPPAQPYPSSSPTLAIVVIWLVVLIVLPVVSSIVIGFVMFAVGGQNSAAGTVVTLLVDLANLVVWAAAIMGTVFLVLRYRAAGDPAKLAAAARWNPPWWPGRLIGGSGRR